MPFSTLVEVAFSMNPANGRLDYSLMTYAEMLNCIPCCGNPLDWNVFMEEPLSQPADYEL